MNGLTCDWIAIDTNILEHRFNPTSNTNDHITYLLDQLLKDRIQLLVDDDGRIRNEYGEQLGNMLRKRIEKQESAGQGSSEQILLRWINNTHEVPLEKNKELFKTIKRIAPQEPRKTDRYFVYVAFARGRILVTNDKEVADKKKEFLRETKAFRRKSESNDKPDILTSCEAAKKNKLEENEECRCQRKK